MKKCKCGTKYNNSNKGDLCPSCRDGSTPEWFERSRESIRLIRMVNDRMDRLK